jgi:SAM-dependent methyltransferase
MHRGRLNQHALRFYTGDTLFDHLARTLCRAGVLPKKELFEAWEVARRVRRLHRGGRVIDLAAGHGLLAYVMLLLDDTSPRALAIDERKPESAEKIARELVAEWPRLEGRVEYVERSIDGELSFERDDLLVSAHACGTLTDRVLELAIASQARVAVLPCCHAFEGAETGGLTGWIDPPLAIDVMRARRLAEAGFEVRTQQIPAEISPKNRLLIACPK